MLQIKGNHLSVAGIKFVPPQNYCIDIEGMESISPDGLRLISPEEDCHICFMTSEIQFDTPVDSLMDIFLDNVLEAEPPENMFNSNGTGFIWIEKPQASEKFSDYDKNNKHQEAVKSDKNNNK